MDSAATGADGNTATARRQMALHPFIAEGLPGDRARITLKAAWGPEHAVYGSTLLHLLSRLKRVGGVIVDASVESKQTRALPKARRRLRIRERTLPLELRRERDLVDLRNAIQAAQAAVKVRTGTTGGNPTRRLELVVRGSDERWPGGSIQAHLVGGRQFATRSTKAASTLVLAASMPYRREAALPATRERRKFDSNPDLQDRGAAAHARTQNAVADVLSRHGLTPLSGNGSGAAYDLAWEWSGGLNVVEVKSLTAANAERQLRLGLGQVLRYRDLARASGASATAWLVTERPPFDEAWSRLCADLDVRLSWPQAFELRLLEDLRLAVAI